MKRLMLTAAMAAMLLPAAAIAGPDGKGPAKGKGGGKQKAEAVRVMPSRGHSPQASGRHDNGLHLGHQRRAWARGERLPTVYLAPRYYVDDYADYRLAPPPRGMVWVQPYENSREFYLVQAATGLISQIFGR